MPLGVDTEVYRPWRRRKLPECRLISTGKAGQRGSPDGFVFITVGLPSFRKNFDFLADAFEALFAKNKNVHLVLGVTHSLTDWKFKLYQKFAKYKSRIWTLEGKYSEYELARIYSSCNAYATANLGEGFNLPMVEAAACGLPVIAPNHTSHPDVAGDKNAWLFETDGSAVHAEGSTVSPWYQGVEFPVLADGSMKALKECLDVVESGAGEVRRRMISFRARIESEFTWDRAAARVVSRLIEVQP
jgi:glycosyltransferase involved in cell wall biosynthesis